MGNALPKLVGTGVLGVILGFLGAKSTQKKLPPSPAGAPEPAKDGITQKKLPPSPAGAPEPAKDGISTDIEAARATRAADRPGNMTANRILADKHRVAVTQWTLIGASSVNFDERFEEPVSAARPNGGECPLTDELDSLFSWVKENGYDGLEMTVDDFRVRWFPGEKYETIIEKVTEASKKTGIPIIGSLYHVTDGCAHPMASVHPTRAPLQNQSNVLHAEGQRVLTTTCICTLYRDGPPGKGAGRRMHTDGSRYDLDFQDQDFWDEMGKRLNYEKALGSGYCGFQISLPNHLMNTGGEYREDTEYLQRVAADIGRLQRLCHERELNFYLETHIARVSEDPAALCKIFDYCPDYFEVNFDVSHYAYRCISTGRYLDRILGRVGHTHQRMCRGFGDLSADVANGDVRSDWEQKGLTHAAWEAMAKALSQDRGLSSRTIVGETGPWMHVRNAMAQDAALVPLYRLMAAKADEHAGIADKDAPKTSDCTNPFSDTHYNPK